MNDLIDLRGRTAVVTGGSRGVGRATAHLLARAGVSVGIGYRSREEEARATVESLREMGVQAWAEAGDLADPEQASSLFRRADREFDGLDIFVGNAGIWPPEEVPLQSMEESQWRRTLAVNLDSIFYTTREAARRLRDGGRIVLVSSTAGQRGEAWHADYAACKGGVISLVKGLCVELGHRGITVNAVAPGWVDTEMAEPAYGGGGREAIAGGIPLGRVASPEDVAGPILFLCSELGRHVTGEILNVNGGAVLVG
ncbi:MAG TPA: SDR family NAD(P)-dependent oxidoreductase [Longimicrobiales bacterium]|nr:SDR family NAD(P)-dependent oxidoreductase [Longimicrobiales bacterium]